ncbi:hypothetical protein ACWGJW_11780, partial [Streptomyces nigrescens]
MSGRPRRVRAARIAVAAVLPGELALAACLVAGVRPPGWALAGAESLVLAVLLLETWVMRSLYIAARARGADRRAARRAAVQETVPVTVRRLVLHERRAFASLGRWVRRGTHGVRPGDLGGPAQGPPRLAEQPAGPRAAEGPRHRQHRPHPRGDPAGAELADRRLP